MKTDFQTKFLQHLLNKKDNAGFTLIELLVVIIIIGILSAIALPSFLNQANKARQSEAKTYIGSLNRGQQAYFLENNGFSGTVAALGIGVSSSTTNYAYTVSPTTANSFSAIAVAGAKQVALRGYVGAVQVTQLAGATTTVAGDEATTLAVLCEAINAGTAVLTSGAVTNFNAGAIATSAIACDGSTVKSIK
jgi:type IV pilus assembly protein PilA